MFVRKIELQILSAKCLGELCSPVDFLIGTSYSAGVCLIEWENPGGGDKDE